MWITFVRNFIFVNYCKHKNITEIVNTFVKKNPEVFVLYYKVQNIKENIYMYTHFIILFFWEFFGVWSRLENYAVFKENFMHLQSRVNHSICHVQGASEMYFRRFILDSVPSVYVLVLHFPRSQCLNAAPDRKIWQIGHWRSGRV